MATKRSLPTPRNEGMANIVAATIRLLGKSSPPEVTLREVAQESGHGHRLIVEWFGGKGGLFAAVFNEIFGNLRESGELYFADVPTRPEVKIAFQVFNYMQIHHPDFVNEVRDSAVMNAVQERMQSGLGMSEDAARVAARRLSALTVGIALFQEFVGLTDDEAIRMMQDEFKTTTGLNLPARK